MTPVGAEAALSRSPAGDPEAPPQPPPPQPSLACWLALAFQDSSERLFPPWRPRSPAEKAAEATTFGGGGAVTVPWQAASEEGWAGQRGCCCCSHLGTELKKSRQPPGGPAGSAPSARESLLSPSGRPGQARQAPLPAAAVRGGAGPRKTSGSATQSGSGFCRVCRRGLADPLPRPLASSPSGAARTQHLAAPGHFLSSPWSHFQSAGIKICSKPTLFGGHAPTPAESTKNTIPKAIPIQI